MTSSPAYLDHGATMAAISPNQAVQALLDALRGGLRPDEDHPRIPVPLRNGEFLLMPSGSAHHAGVKVLTVAPDNPARGLDRIQGLYVLFDAQTLAPQMLLEGSALTMIRTAAVSIAAVRPALLDRTEAAHVVVYGTGPQGVAHVHTLRAVLAGRREIASVTMIARNPRRPEGMDDVNLATSGSEQAQEATARADVIMCATTARTPLFDSRAVRDDAVVTAVGSHEPDARELDGALMGRAQVVVEDVATALRESGDVVMAIDEGALTAGDLITMAEVATGAAPLSPDRPVVFKSSGMSWQDLVIAGAIAGAGSARP